MSGLPTVTGEFGVVDDPTIQFNQQGKAWMRVRGVAKDRVRDSTGQWADGDPCFITIVIFGKVAENLAESCAKGDLIAVTGQLTQRSWDDKDGNKHSEHQIKAESVSVSLRWGYAKTAKVSAASPSAPAAASDDPWQQPATDEPPY